MCKRRSVLIEAVANDKGFTLLEIIAVSVIALLFMGMATTYMTRADANTDLIIAQQALTNVQVGVKGAFKSRGNYLGLSNAIANALGIFPAEMVDTSSGLTIRHRFNGTVTVQANASNSLLQEQIWTNLPMVACMELALYSPGSWVSVDINGTPVDPNADTAMADTNNACNATGNTITWNSN